MSKPSMLQDRFVYPGERLSVIEEFSDGSGSYERNGVVRATELGLVKYSLDKREVAVSKRTRELVLPREGLEVVGDVGTVQRRMVNVDVFIIGSNEIPSTYTGVIHISNVDSAYAKNLSLAVRSGDIVKARIINTKNRIVQLSIDGADYGVVYAFCSRCGAILEYHKTRLHCPSCGRVERRKVAKKYGVEKLV